MDSAGIQKKSINVAVAEPMKSICYDIMWFISKLVTDEERKQ